MPDLDLKPGADDDETAPAPHLNEHDTWAPDEGDECDHSD